MPRNSDTPTETPALTHEPETTPIASPAASLTLYARFGEVRVIGKGTVEHAVQIVRAGNAERAEELFAAETAKSKEQNTPFSRVKNASNLSWPSEGTHEGSCTVVGAQVKQGEQADYERALR